MSDAARQVSVPEARDFLDSTRPSARTLLDVRQDFEYAEGHLPGATLIPLPELADRVGEIDKALPVLTYCRSGKRSLAAANLLAGQGFGDVASMAGGILAWEGAQAYGPPDLGLGALLAAASPEEALSRAWGMEFALEEFYTALAAKAADNELAALFQRLAGFETRHCRTLTEIWTRRTGGDAAAFEQGARQAVAPGVLEGGISFAQYMDFLDDPADAAQALELALAIEAQALDLYLRRAAAAGDADLRRTLLLLAAEEKAHLKVLGTFVDGRGRF